jgi:hypothetical protein
VIAELHAQCAFDHKEQLVLVFMMMQDKFAFEFDGFDVAAVYLADDARVAIVGKAAEFFF